MLPIQNLEKLFLHVLREERRLTRPRKIFEISIDFAGWFRVRAFVIVWPGSTLQSMVSSAVFEKHENSTSLLGYNISLALKDETEVKTRSFSELARFLAEYTKERMSSARNYAKRMYPNKTFVLAKLSFPMKRMYIRPYVGSLKSVSGILEYRSRQNTLPNTLFKSRQNLLRGFNSTNRRRTL